MTGESHTYPPPRPRPVELAVTMLALSLLLAVIAFLVPGIGGRSDTAVTVGQVLGLLLQGVLAWQIWNGRKWARVVFTIFGAISLLVGIPGVVLLLGTLPPGGTVLLTVVLGVIQLVLTVAVLVQLYREPSNVFFNARQRPVTP